MLVVWRWMQVVDDVMGDGVEVDAGGGCGI